MSNLSPRERLQPALLDRLTNDGVGGGARTSRVIGMRELREAIRRDLQWLLGTHGIGVTQPLDDYPEVATSVLNYGGPVLAGHPRDSIVNEDIERRIRQAIHVFEPRLQRDGLRVTVEDEEASGRGTLVIRIEGMLLAQPLSEHLYLKTVVDLETGTVTAQESAGADA